MRHEQPHRLIHHDRMRLGEQSGLSFLGLGVTPPQPEWGLMLNSLRQAIYVRPYVAALPGLMIFLTSMCFNLMSDGFRGAMDVRLSK